MEESNTQIANAENSNVETTVETTTIENAENNDANNSAAADAATKAEIAKLRNALSKANSEAANYKKQLRAKMSDEEIAKAESAKAMEELQDKYNALLRDSTIANHTARYMAMPGYDEKLARDTAQALFDGDMDKVFQNQQKANAEYEKKIRAELVKQDPRPNGAGSDGNEEPESVQIARKIGKSRFEAAKNATDVLKKYTI